MKAFRRIVSARCVPGIVALVFSAGAFAAPSFIVDSTADAVDDQPGDGVCHTAAGTCTLRAAIMEANRSASGAIINLPAGTYVLQIPPATGNDEASGDLDLIAPDAGTREIDILGAGAANTIIDGNQLDRVLNVQTSVSAYIRGVTIRGGYNADFGGGVLSGGSVEFDHVTIGPHNVAGGTGGGVFIAGTGLTTFDHVEIIQNSAGLAGGIYNDGTIEVRGSSVSANTSGDAGGGFVNNGHLAIIDSTVATNTALTSGGGIFNKGVLTVVNSTIARNQADLAGGGLYAEPALGASILIHSSTIAYNGAYSQVPGYGGGIYIQDSTSVTLRNTLLAGNSDYGDQGSFEDCYTGGGGILNTFGGNVLSTLNGCNTSNSVTLLNSLDYLGGLENNGGPTQTIALLSGSNAINAGNICFDTSGTTLLTDQRGYARLIGNRCDAGAYEFDPDRIFTNGFDD